MNFKRSKLERLERYLFRYIRAGTSPSLPTMKRFEIFDEESWTRSDPLSSCLSEEQVRHASRRTSLFLIDPASALWTVTNPTCRSRGFPRTLDRLQFAFWYSTFYTKRLLCPPSRAFVLYHEIFPHNPESSVLTIAPRMKRNYGGKKVGPCEKQKLIVTLGRSMALCNPIWSTEQTHRSRMRARSGFLQGARLKTTCRCCSSLDDNLPWVGESNSCASTRPTRVYCTPWEAIERVLSMKCQKPNAYLRLWQYEQQRPCNDNFATRLFSIALDSRWSINRLIRCFRLNVNIVFAMWTFWYIKCYKKYACTKIWMSFHKDEGKRKFRVIVLGRIFQRKIADQEKLMRSCRTMKQFES